MLGSHGSINSVSVTCRIRNRIRFPSSFLWSFPHLLSSCSYVRFFRFNSNLTVVDDLISSSVTLPPSTEVVVKFNKSYKSYKHLCVVMTQFNGERTLSVSALVQVILGSSLLYMPAIDTYTASSNSFMFKKQKMIQVCVLNITY